MAHTKAKGSTRNNRDSQSKRLGVKVYGGEVIKVGGIIVRQRGSKFYAGTGVMRSGDDSIYAVTDGVIKFTRKFMVSHSGKKVEKTFVNVVKASTETPVKATVAKK